MFMCVCGGDLFVCACVCLCMLCLAVAFVKDSTLYSTPVLSI